VTERDERFLLYIQESIKLIHRYTSGGRQAFVHDRMVQDATLRRLETLADATGKLSSALKDRHPEIAWHEVYGFRNVAAHAYLSLSLEQVWEIVEVYLPPLKSVVDEELEGERDDDESR